MYPTLDPLIVVERLIESDTPVWHLWDRDRTTLLQALTVAVHREFSVEDRPGMDQHTRALRRTRLIWLLDRLAPDSDGSIFEPFLSHFFGVYAWGRRLPPERRNELVCMPLPDDGPSSRMWFLQALLLAWCDSCPDTQLSCLLEWPEHWMGVLRLHDRYYLPNPVEEFRRRCTDEGIRRDVLLASLRRNLASLNDPHEQTREWAYGIALGLWKSLLRDAAVRNPGKEQPPPDPKQWLTWFDLTLSETPFTELAEVGKQLPRAPRQNEYLVQSLWIWRHGEEQWKDLYSYAFGNLERRVFDRLAEIVPPDELEAWDDLVLYEPTDHGEIRAFCKWVPPKYAEALRAHFNHSDRDWRVCAYQNYVSKAPEAILRHY